MNGLRKSNFTLAWITGALFFCFGAYLLLTAVVRFPNPGAIPGGILALAALARLALVSLPASGPGFAGSGALEIASGSLEALFGVVFVLNAYIYIEFFYPLVAGLLAVLAAVRIRQGALARKQGFAGMAAYLFAGILLLVCAAGMLLDMVWLHAGLLTELIGAAAFLYGVFLFASAFFKREPDIPEEENNTETAETPV